MSFGCKPSGLRSNPVKSILTFLNLNVPIPKKTRVFGTKTATLKTHGTTQSAPFPRMLVRATCNRSSLLDLVRVI